MASRYHLRDALMNTRIISPAERVTQEIATKLAQQFHPMTRRRKAMGVASLDQSNEIQEAIC